MKILDLRQTQISLTALLQAARQESIKILSEDGSQFILEIADEFDQEVTELGHSEKFMSFLAERSQEPGSISLEDFEQRLM